MADELPPAVKETLLKAFTILDREGSGSLSQRDITRLMNTMLKSDLDEMTLAEIMSEVCDSDTAGVGVTFDMFCKAVGPVIASCSEEEISKRAFAAMDADGSGCISATELRPLMSAVAGTKLTTQQADDVLQLAAGKDGKVRYKEYQAATTKA
jgi:Ca2+-binding EF-hand superfamily protein